MERPRGPRQICPLERVRNRSLSLEASPSDQSSSLQRCGGGEDGFGHLAGLLFGAQMTALTEGHALHDDDLQLDIGGNFGLNQATPDFQLYVGLSTRF